MSDIPTLLIGNKNYSSWSLRPWLLLKHFDIAFQEQRLPFHSDAFYRLIGNELPTGKVPVLVLPDGTRVWESLAICETVSEWFLDGAGWPREPQARATARAVSAEMHVGFPTLRSAMPMNCRARDRRVTRAPALDAEIERVHALWAGCRERYGHQGPWLFGTFSIADAMYAPVASRFRTYGVSGMADAYVDTVLSHPAVRLWYADAAAEQEQVLEMEVGGVDDHQLAGFRED